jgi:hypothetical protein
MISAGIGENPMVNHATPAASYRESAEEISMEAVFFASSLLPVKEKSRNARKRFGFLGKTGGNLLSRKLYNHYHRQDCV